MNQRQDQNQQGQRNMGNKQQQQTDRPKDNQDKKEVKPSDKSGDCGC